MQAQAGAQSLGHLRQPKTYADFLFFNYPFHYASKKKKIIMKNVNYEFVSPAKKNNNNILEN